MYSIVAAQSMLLERGQRSRAAQATQRPLAVVRDGSSATVLPQLGGKRERRCASGRRPHWGAADEWVHCSDQYWRKLNMPRACALGGRGAVTLKANGAAGCHTPNEMGEGI